MTTAIKRRRGTTTQHSSFTGLEGELTVDTTKDTVVVHDGSTAGGFALLREDLSNNTNVITATNTKTLTNKTVDLASNTLTGTTAQFNTALSDGDFATLAGTETLSNKTFSTNPTISSGTANGVAYLNGSKVLTTGSALTFDGTNLGLGTSSPTIASSRNGMVVRANSVNGAEFIMQSTNATAGTFGGYATAVTGNDVYFLNRLDGFFAWNTGGSGGSEQMRLTSTGLGIGTSSPDSSAKLDVQGGRTYLTANSSGLNLYLRYNTSTAGVFLGSPSVDALSVYNSAGTERLRLASSGNLGLGVTPSAWGNGFRSLQVGPMGAFWGSTAATYLTSNEYFDGASSRYITNNFATDYAQFNGQHVWFTAPSGTAGNAISFTQAMTLDASGNLSIANTNGGNRLRITGVDNTGVATTIRVESLNQAQAVNINYNSVTCDTGVLYLGTTGNFATIFKNNNTERMRIDSSGRLLVGTTGIISGSGATIQATATDGPAFAFNRSNDGGIGYFYRGGSGPVGEISVTASSTAYVTSSDYRLKKNIQPMTNALAKVAALKPVTYQWKVDDSDGQGFIAHELQAVVPDCVTGEKDAVDAEGKPVYQGVDTSFLVATLTKAIQEQQELINQLTARVAQLEGN